MVLEKTLESPLDFKEIKLVNSKGSQPEYSLEGLMITEAEVPILWPLDVRSRFIGKDLMLGKIVSKRRRE